MLNLWPHHIQFVVRRENSKKDKNLKCRLFLFKEEKKSNFKIVTKTKKKLKKNVADVKNQNNWSDVFLNFKIKYFINQISGIYYESDIFMDKCHFYDHLIKKMHRIVSFCLEFWRV